MFNKFEIGLNIVKATKKTCCVKGTVDHSTVTRCFKKFHSGCKKNFDYKPDQVGLKLDSGVALVEYQVSSASHNTVEIVIFTTNICF